MDFYTRNVTLIFLYYLYKEILKCIHNLFMVINIFFLNAYFLYVNMIFFACE